MTDTKNCQALSMKELRERAKLTQRYVASQLDIRVHTMGDWESGRTEPRIPISKVVKLIQLYGCSAEELAQGVEIARLANSQKQKVEAKPPEELAS